ncbi:hypothetical protein D9M72_555230 [compost metagenome]
MGFAAVVGSLNRILPPTLATLGKMPITAWLIADLPDPDSPTSAVTLPDKILKFALLTA